MNDLPLEQITTKIFEGDRETLQRFYPKPVGYQRAIRYIVHEHCKALLEAESREGVSSARPSLTAEQLADLGIQGGDDVEHTPSGGDS